MLNEKMEKALNKQINEEYYSSYLYVSMVAYFESLNLPGFANWMRIQAQEELVHVMKFFDYVNERGGRVTLDAIKKPAVEWASPLAAFEDAYKHECYISGCIHELANLAAELKDHPSHNFLEWFVEEQVEEEASADAIVQRLKLGGDSGAAMLMIDQELSQRVFTPPPSGEGE
ncbi:MAG: ferritin [Planctomycetota bacterium]|jgi:ferritin